MRIVSIVVCLILWTSQLQAQNQDSLSTLYVLIPDSSTIVVEGTSNAHDWDTKSSSLEGIASFNFSTGSILTIDSVNIQLKSDSFRSGKKVMDKKTRGALKVKDNPVISFELKEFSRQSGDSVWVNGDFTVAGKTVSKLTKAVVLITESDQVSVSGYQNFRMTEFDVKPPTALLGSLKTGDEVTVRFEVLFTKEEQQ